MEILVDGPKRSTGVGGSPLGRWQEQWASACLVGQQPSDLGRGGGAGIAYKKIMFFLNKYWYQ
jgi:hypothetical protein